ncbi:MAG: NAD(P)/FAD-dependent oxidoreductase [Oscillospiraceae bacterium]|nr:NAD(P)/FAD-dependent oxidoreductase [Oscillospiraceae bacterium]
MTVKKIAVIGGGAAGLMAAGEAAAHGADVTLFEKNEKLGKKLFITGKGRCNVTNFCDTDEFMQNTANNGRFLYSALNYFAPRDCMDFFEALGTELKIERGNRVFPLSDKSSDIIDALKKFVKTNGAAVKFIKADKITTANGEVTGILCGGVQYAFDRVIICTGGLSYRSTGSNGDGYRFAREAGHRVTALRPSLVPLEIHEKLCADLMGLSLKNIKLTLYENDNKIFEDMGEMLFCHFGVSGPLVLSASAHISDIKTKEYKIKLDLKPGLGAGQLDRRILSDFDKYKNKDFKNCLNDLLPKKMIPVFIDLLKDTINPEKKVNEISRAERAGLAALFKNFILSVKKFRPLDEAIITRGGVETAEIYSNKMESKLIGGLFFAGEVIDVDAYTGGFNLQIAFSTGKLAGKTAALN